MALAGAVSDRYGIVEDSALIAITIAPFEACGGGNSAGFPGIRLSISATLWPDRVVDIHEENTMKTNEKRIRIVGGKRYTDYGKQDLAVLADARRWLNGHGLKRFDLDEDERARRAEIYRQQIEEAGRIEYLPPAPERERRRLTTRFFHGDALGRHLAACAG